VDHTNSYDLPVVGCFDHHPEIVHIEHNYINEPKTSCAKVIYDWADSIGFEVPRSLTTLVVYACYMDSLSFKSTKARQEDLEWCNKQMEKYDMNKQEIEKFGYGLTPNNGNYEGYIKTGKKTYPFGDNQICSSYIVVDHNEADLDYAATILKRELDEHTIAWCLIVQDVKDDETRIVLVTSGYYLIQSVAKLLSRGKDVIPAVMEFLSAKNDGTVTKMLIDRNLEIATMESCTSGLIASNITDYEGASAILKGSCITYSNETKILSGVRRGIIDRYGVYSPETAFEMSLTTKMKFDSDIGVGITGSFGNVDPTNHDSVAGTVYYAIIGAGSENPIKLVFHSTNASRKEMKRKTVDVVFATLQTMLTCV
jgi:PncC family amidohydrolase